MWLWPTAASLYTMQQLETVHGWRLSVEFALQLAAGGGFYFHTHQRLVQHGYHSAAAAAAARSTAAGHKAHTTHNHKSLSPAEELLHLPTSSPAERHRCAGGLLCAASHAAVQLQYASCLLITSLHIANTMTAVSHDVCQRCISMLHAATSKYVEHSITSPCLLLPSQLYTAKAPFAGHCGYGHKVLDVIADQVDFWREVAALGWYGLRGWL